jgi:integrase
MEAVHVAKSTKKRTSKTILKLLDLEQSKAADCGLLSPDLAAGIRRVKGAKRLGVRVGNWLSADQGRLLLRVYSGTRLRTRRNQAILAVLVGCGLRRAEVVTLRVEDIQLREDHWAIADLVGKGGHMRTGPIPEWIKAYIDRWTSHANVRSGILFRSINKVGRVWGGGFTPKAAADCGFPGVAPHDLRRTCARLCHQAGGELEQIQFLLGPSGISDASNASEMR